MLTYSFAQAGNVPKYEFLYQCIKQDIVQGKLPAGTRLPSKRAFAKNQSVSVVTVENTYAQLLAEGYIFSKPRSGFFVNPVSPPAPILQAVQVETHADTAPSAPVFADLLSNRTAQHSFPFATWAKLMREVISEQKNQLQLPSEGQGILELRQAIASYLRDFRGLLVQPEQIIVGAGTEYLYGLLIQLLGYDKTYAVEDPGYPKIRMIYQAHGVQCCPIAMDKKGLCPHALEASPAQIVHLSPAHHFPTGIVMPIGRRYEIFDWALKDAEHFIIEDEYDSEFRLTGNPIPTLASLDEAGRVIYMNTFTKSLAPTIRIGYMVLPMALLRKFQERLGFYACTVSNFEQYTLARFIQKGYFEKHINRMRNRYRALRDQLIQSIRKEFLPEGGRIQEEEAGLHFLLHLKTFGPDEALVQRAAQKGLRVACLSQYYAQTPLEPTHTLLLNYSGLEQEKIPAVVERLKAIL